MTCGGSFGAVRKFPYTHPVIGLGNVGIAPNGKDCGRQTGIGDTAFPSGSLAILPALGRWAGEWTDFASVMSIEPPEYVDFLQRYFDAV
jgi:hypothetical protein